MSLDDHPPPHTHTSLIKHLTSMHSSAVVDILLGLPGYSSSVITELSE